MESGGRHHDISRHLLAGGEDESGLGEPFDLPGHHGEVPASDRFEQVAVEDQAQPVIPDLVTRPEMGIAVIAWREFAFRAIDDGLAHTFWNPAGEIEGECHQGDVLGADDL
ncbi:Uncharacterised protein [Mycobacteroides abscessus subsp. massiliense]|nr:Uncharacterised protein [Mycobacteroides abscessus subsp. massiliense]